MSAAFAPAHLPAAPRPFPDELLSSWLLRLAAANAISLEELLSGLQWRYPHSQHLGHLLDYAVPPETLQALSLFARVPYANLRRLDLGVRSRQLNPNVLLRFQRASLRCPRSRVWRVRYAFCPQCLAEQEAPHIRWDWCFAALIHCVVHSATLWDACPACQELDPLTFSARDGAFPLRCRYCSVDLTRVREDLSHLSEQSAVSLMEAAYRFDLMDVPAHPHLDETADRGFRRFVEDMLQIFALILSSSARRSSSFESLLISRPSFITIIADMAVNDAPPPSAQQGRCRKARGLALWATLLKVIPAAQGEGLERSSQHWPPSLRQLFADALTHRRNKRWPYSPFPNHLLSPRFRYNELSTVLDLSTRPAVSHAKSRI
jgi:hypothetical protein